MRREDRKKLKELEQGYARKFVGVVDNNSFFIAHNDNRKFGLGKGRFWLYVKGTKVILQGGQNYLGYGFHGLNEVSLTKKDAKLIINFLQEFIDMEVI